jgi:selenocysteine-specific elongation factor
MTAPALTLGTAGHIDHGKTALVRALTGVDTDRLPEERERGISIELGFARMELPSGGSLSVVDVPGHERFVRTMVAGATGVDLFLLVVAADDGVMPQSREHVAVMELLEVPAGVVALTKMDLVGAEQAAEARAGIAELLAGGPYAGAPVVDVSATGGTGLGELRARLAAAAASAAPNRGAPGGSPRLHVDRSFSLPGIGTVVTGTLWSGSVARGDEVRIEPRRRRARVRAVQVHSEPRERAAAGQRVALNLAGVDRGEVRRGDVIVAGDAGPAAGYLLDVELRLLPGARPLRRGARVHVHHGTRESPARVAPVEGDLLHPGGAGLAQLRLERPLLALAGDRFVVRSIAPADTVGGGRVLDPRPVKHGAGEAHARRLRALGAGDPLELLRLELEDAASGVDGEDRGAELERLAAAGEVVPVGRRTRRWFTPRLLDSARAGLLAAVGADDDPRPRSAAALAHAAGIDPQAAAAVLETLSDEGEVDRRGGGYVRPRRAPGPLDPLAQRLLALLEADGLQPGSVDALADRADAPRPAVAAALERLAATGDVTRVKPGIYYEPGALERAAAEVAAICDRDGAVTIAGLRDRLGTSRKYAQALLEHLDSTRVTRRVGDEHVLRRPPPG